MSTFRLEGKVMISVWDLSRATWLGTKKYALGGKSLGFLRGVSFIAVL